MKKIIPLILISCFFLPIKSAQAAFDITTDLTHINFGSVNPGETIGDIPVQGLNVTCTSDQGNQWFLRIYTETPFRHDENPGMIISDEDFWWYGVDTTGAGTLVTTEEDMTSEKTIYTSTATEGANGIGITVKFKLRVPKDIQSGAYSTRMIFTLTE
jgi:hypothetical protein